MAIIGGGPAGLLLSEILHRAGVESIVLERQSREHVLSRIRAGVLEQTTVEVLRANDLAERMEREGHPHDGIRIAWAGRATFFLDTLKHAGKRFMAYGQSAIQEDLFAAADRRSAQLLTEVDGVQLNDHDGDHPYVTCQHDGQTLRIACDFVAGCDGFHGVSRPSIPREVRRECEKIYPFGWLGIMARTPPLPDVTYVNHPRGFALASMRNPMLSRYYIQVPLDTKIEDWPDERFWSELKLRFPQRAGRSDRRRRRRSRSRSRRCAASSPSRCATAACSSPAMPPTSCRPPVPRVSTSRSRTSSTSSRALPRTTAKRTTKLPRRATREMALRRVWSSARTSWYLTKLLHRYPDASSFDQRAQEAELDYLTSSARALAALAEMYAGRPLEEA